MPLILHATSPVKRGAKPAGAEADWVARSTGAGVAWAHNFASESEVAAFIDADPATTTTAYEADGGIVGGAVVHNIPGNVPSDALTMTAINGTTVRVTTTDDLGLTTSDYVRFFGLPAPWDVANDSYDGGSGVIEGYKVTAVNSSTSFDIDPTQELVDSYGGFDPTGFSAYSGGSSPTAQRCRVSVGSWNRPMSALAAGSYGNAADDPGVTNLSMPARSWDSTYSSVRHYRYRRDYYGHADYATRIETWPDWDGSATTDNYRGADFWVQWRVKISASRWQASGAALKNSESLKYFAAWTTWRTPLHEVVWNDRNTPSATYASYLASDGGTVDGYTGAGTTKAFSDGTSMQAGGDYAGTCLWTGSFPESASACFNIVPDEWMTFLMHVVPGKQVASWSGWPTSADSALGTGIQLFATTQSRIDSQRAASQTPTYLTIFSKIGATAYPFQYDNWNPDAYSSSEPPPAWNSVQLWTYQNNIPQIYGFTRRFSQIIFKKGNGGTNPETDGIPCPQY